jgi:hypothetical protein
MNDLVITESYEKMWIVESNITEDPINLFSWFQAEEFGGDSRSKRNDFNNNWFRWFPKAKWCS